MVMRDPVTLASVELRGFKLNEPVLPVAPASVVLTATNPCFDPLFQAKLAEAAAAKEAKEKLESVPHFFCLLAFLLFAHYLSCLLIYSLSS